MEINSSVVKLHEIIVPGDAIVNSDYLPFGEADDDFFKMTFKSKKSDEHGKDLETIVDLKKFTHLFIVMEQGGNDLK